MNSFEKNSSSYLARDSKAIAAMEQSEKMATTGRRIFDQQAKVQNRQTQYTKFVTESKSFLLTEALYHLFIKSIPTSTSESESLTKLGRSVIESFVNEEGATNLLNQMKGKTFFLDGMSRIVEETHKKICSDCSTKEIPFQIPVKDVKVLHDDLDKLEADKISEEISKRVAAAEEKFIQANLEDKEKMDKLAAATQEKIDAVKNKNTDTANAIKQEHTITYRRHIGELEQRKKSILEGIVLRLSKAIVTEDTTREMYTLESGKLNMDYIIESAEVMYTVLEMVNTVRLKKIDRKYLKEVLASIQ